VSSSITRLLFGFLVVGCLTGYLGDLVVTVALWPEAAQTSAPVPAPSRPIWTDLSGSGAGIHLRVDRDPSAYRLAQLSQSLRGKVIVLDYSIVDSALRETGVATEIAGELSREHPCCL